MKIKKRELLFLTIFAIYLLMSKLFFNEDSDVHGSFKASLAAYQVAMLNIVFIFGIILLRIKSLFVIKLEKQLIIIFSYYLFALISVVYSALPTVTAFRAFSGLGFYYAITVAINIYSNEHQIKLIKFLWVLLIFSFLSSLIFYIKHYGFNIVFGISSGYSALIACLLALYYVFCAEKNTTINKFLAIALFVAAVYMKSFSAIISFIIAYLFLLFMNKQYIKFIILIAAIIIPINGAILYLSHNPEQIILGKPAGAYLIGSGRFDVYSAAADLYINRFDLIQKIIGVGFMSEREYLKYYDLTWSTDPHNSFIMSTLGLGIIGAIIYIVFVIFPFIYLGKESYRKSKEYVYSVATHLASVVYGITSSQYLGTPSVLLIVSTTFLLHAKYQVKKQSIYK